MLKDCGGPNVSTTEYSWGQWDRSEPASLSPTQTYTHTLSSASLPLVSLYVEVKLKYKWLNIRTNI